jgi:hypothetical protein
VLASTLTPPVAVARSPSRTQAPRPPGRKRKSPGSPFRLCAVLETRFESTRRSWMSGGRQTLRTPRLTGWPGLTVRTPTSRWSRGFAKLRSGVCERPGVARLLSLPWWVLRPVLRREPDWQVMMLVSAGHDCYCLMLLFIITVYCSRTILEILITVGSPCIMPDREL